MDNETAVTETKGAEVGQVINGLGAADQVTMDDIQITRLKIAQPSSDATKEDKVRAGAIFDKDTYDELAYKEEKPLEFVVLASKKTWLIEEGGEYRVEPALNKSEKPWEHNGVKNTFFHSFFVLIKSEVEEHGFALPYELSFSSSGLQTASAISKLLLKMKIKGVPSYAYSFIGTTALKKKAQHSWFAMQIKFGEKCSDKVIKMAQSIPVSSLIPDTQPVSESTTGTVAEGDKY